MPDTTAKFFTPETLSEYLEGTLTLQALAQRRYRGLAPKFIKPTPRSVLYRREDVDEWIAQSVRSVTNQVA